MPSLFPSLSAYVDVATDSQWKQREAEVFFHEIIVLEVNVGKPDWFSVF